MNDLLRTRLHTQSWRRSSSRFAVFLLLAATATSLPAIPTYALDGDSSSASSFTSSGIETGIEKPLVSMSITLDDVRLINGNVLQVSVTFKKLTETTSDAIQVDLVDNDGVGMSHRGNLYHATQTVGEPGALRVPLQLRQKDETQQLSYLFDLPKGITPLRRLVFRENNKEQSFNVAGFKVPFAVTTQESKLIGGSTTAELGNFDVRLDGIQRGRGNTLYAFVTVKNAGAKVQNFTSSTLDLRLLDARGGAKRANGNLYRASGIGTPSSISLTVHISADSEAKFRYVFPWAKTQSPSALKVINCLDTAETHTFSLPKLP